MAIVTGRCGNVTVQIGGVDQVFNVYSWSGKEDTDMRPASIYGMADSAWRRFRPSMKGWTATVSFYADNALGTLCTGEEVAFVGIVEATAVEWSGQAWVESIEHTNDKTGDAINVMTLLGEGKLTKTPPATCTECA